MKKFISIFLTCFLCLLSNAFGEILDPLDPFDRPDSVAESENEDSDKSAMELIEEAQHLLMDERLLDARTKLLRALEKDPKRYEAHILLSSYYIRHVGHFRLALKYIKRARQLFEEEHGPPPYSDPLQQYKHSQVLYLISQSRLNLDNYSGALELLDEYSSYGYTSEWYASSRAWILMKLGDLDEAIKIARTGMLAGAEPGRTLNMLGILLSMKNERKAALDVFRRAVLYETALGRLGQPATPLNNQGEVYKEIFNENMAELSWLKSTSLPDGCEHVLPALNLALLYIEQTNYRGAKKTLDNFESCVAQFPLRNGEEHKALVHLARGRVDLHTGNVEQAIKHFESALERKQWFGKIGTNIEDLQVGVLISLAQALEIQNNHLKKTNHPSIAASIGSSRVQVANRIRAWWYRRRARQILSEDLENLEDIYIRHTDSMVEYPSFGYLLKDFPTRTLKNRIALEKKTDERREATLYYKGYIAENLLRHGNRDEGISLLREVISNARSQFDDALKLHAQILLLQKIRTEDEAYKFLAFEAFETARASIRNYGLMLPVNFQVENSKVKNAMENANFTLDNSKEFPYTVSAEHSEGKHILSFVASKNSPIGTIKVRGEDLKQTVNKFAATVFSPDFNDEK